MTKNEIIHNIKVRITTIKSLSPVERTLNEGALFELEDLLSMIEKDEPSLPSNLDEVALQWCDSVKFYSDLSGTPINAFKAGAKWMAEQGISCEAEAIKDVGVSFLKDPFEKAAKEFDGKIIVQIRKKEE